MDELEKELQNITTEILLVGSFFKQPDLSVSWSSFIRSKYDFNDPVTRFMYDNFTLMYSTFSQTMEETKVNAFMSQNELRFKEYRTNGGYKTIQDWMNLSDPNDFKNYFDIVKKYSLVREYHRQGFNVEKLVHHKKFNEWNATDIYKLIRSKADKISTVILANEEAAILNEGTTKDIFGYLVKPQMGLAYPWPILNEIFRGCRLGKLVINAFLSNEGKSRNLMMLVAYITLVKGEKFLLMSNEMAEEDLRSCLITTVINNTAFKELHGIDIYKTEKELVLGQYRNSQGSFIERKTDDDGAYIETEDEFKVRVYQESEEFRKVVQIGEWVEKKTDKLIFFKDVGNDYSDERLEFEIRKHNLVHGVKYFGYDTLKGYRTEEWMNIKQTATKIKEIMKEINCFCWSVFQLADSTVFTDIFEMSSNNLASAKHVKHVVDYLILGKKLNAEEYSKYQYVNYDCWGEPQIKYLDPNKKYFGMIIDKNRNGSKVLAPLFEYDLDLNLWDNIGSLQRR